jgi:hypothetical protein
MISQGVGMNNSETIDEQDKKNTNTKKKNTLPGKGLDQVFNLISDLIS